MPIQVGDLKLYEVKELSELLNIQERTIRKLLREGTLKAKKLARKWYVSEESLKEYFSQDDPGKDKSKGDPLSASLANQASQLKGETLP